MSAPDSDAVSADFERVSEKWKLDYTTLIRSGAIYDIKPEVPFTELNTDYLDIKLRSSECILLIPDDKKEENNDMTDVNPLPKHRCRIYRLPLLKPTCGHRTIDIRPLLSKSGVSTYDPGFVSTASCHSTITFIDGPKGILLHRGYRIEDLCNNSDFEELSFLLLYGELPNQADKKYHVQQIKSHTLVHEKLNSV